MFKNLTITEWAAWLGLFLGLANFGWQIATQLSRGELRVQIGIAEINRQDTAFTYYAVNESDKPITVKLVGGDIKAKPSLLKRWYFKLMKKEVPPTGFIPLPPLDGSYSMPYTIPPHGGTAHWVFTVQSVLAANPGNETRFYVKDTYNREWSATEQERKKTIEHLTELQKNAKANGI